MSASLCLAMIHKLSCDWMLLLLRWRLELWARLPM